MILRNYHRNALDCNSANVSTSLLIVLHFIYLFFQFHDLYIPKQIISSFDKMKKSQRKTIYQDSLVNLEIWNNTYNTYLSLCLSVSVSLSQFVSVSLCLSVSLYLSLCLTLFPHLYFSILNYLIISCFGIAIFYHSIIFLFTKKKYHHQEMWCLLKKINRNDFVCSFWVTKKFNE